MNARIASLYDEYLSKTGNNAPAAATLVLADILAGDGEEDALSAETVASKLKVHVNTVRALCAEGKLQHTRVGRKIRIRPEWLADYQRLGTTRSRHGSGSKHY